MSNLILCYDTETTGFPSSKKALTDPAQPHLVSLSALQVLPTGRIQQSMSKMVKPQGWEWEPSHPAAQVHGLTHEECTTYGNSEKSVLDEFLHLWFASNEPSVIIAHNLAFDRAIISVALARYYPGEAQLLQTWLDTPGVCTQRANKEAVDARTVKGAKKMPNLKETYKHFTGNELESHHSANADAVAVYTIYMHMQQAEQE